MNDDLTPELLTDDLTPELLAVREATVALAQGLERCGNVADAVPVIVAALSENGIELPDSVKMMLGAG